jgi:membrane-associated phospholipid phosphatase
MYTLPLEAPLTMIALKDPFIEFFGNGQTLTKDLFFSGHTATSFLLFLAMKNKYIKPIFLAISISMAIFVLMQHVHYTVDVIAAPFFSYGSYMISKSIHYKYY